MASKRQQILQAFVTRLAVITTANGYNTDAGKNVFWGTDVTIGPDDPPAGILVAPGPDIIVDYDPVPTTKSIRLPIVIQAAVPANLGNPGQSIEELVEDVKKAIELDYRTWLDDLVDEVDELEPGETTPLEREEGTTSVGMEIEYIILYAETWGAP